MQHPAFSHPDPVWLHVSSVRPQCVCVITHVALVDALGRHVGLFFIAEYVHGMHFVHESYKFLVGMELLSSLNFTVTFDQWTLLLTYLVNILRSQQMLVASILSFKLITILSFNKTVHRCI